ncbi:aldo/keto reductase [Nostoc sp.]|uniref:aldo/keto reductase n=1 Tax=Nostoc sp. TaxID=1180 RepID=UPI002FF9D92D
MRTVRRARSQTRTARSHGDVVSIERLIPIVEETGLSLMHMALPFVMAHTGVTSAIIAPRKMEHLDDLLAASEVILDDQVLDQIDKIVAPGTDVGSLDASYNLPAIMQSNLRRRPTAERTASFMPLNPSIAVAPHERLASGEPLLLQLACGL